MSDLSDLSYSDLLKMEVGMDMLEYINSLPPMTIDDLSKRISHIIGVTCPPQNIRHIVNRNNLQYIPSPDKKGGRGRGHLQARLVKYMEPFLSNYNLPVDYDHAIFFLANCKVDLWKLAALIAVKERLTKSSRHSMYSTIIKDVRIEHFFSGEYHTPNKGMIDKLKKITALSADHQKHKTMLKCLLLDGAQLFVYKDGTASWQRSLDGVFYVRTDQPLRVITHLNVAIARARESQSSDEIEIYKELLSSVRSVVEPYTSPVFFDFTQANSPHLRETLSKRKQHV
jgi:hypothetical protein